jgi:pilus assembly protein CpaF
MNAEREREVLEATLHAEVAASLEADLVAERLEPPLSREVVQARAEAIAHRHRWLISAHTERDLVRLVVDRTVGIGPLQPLLDDPEVTDILVNDPDHVFIERRGRIEATPIHFRDEDDLRHIIDRIVAPLGRRIDESSPLVDARLGDGSRVNAILPPLALAGPVLTIRKFSPQPFTLDRLISLGTLPEEAAAFLHRCVADRLAIIVSGGTGSGKTSTLNALSRCIPAGERVITIEDAAELQLQHAHLVSLEARPPNLEGQGEITIRTLVRNALRMRPDRIIVGEVRGGEAFDMLQAMNTGHRGSMTTLHANSPADALVRLESMVLMAGFDIPLTAIQRMIAGALEIVVQQDRLPDGARRITAIDQLIPQKDNPYFLQPVFTSASPESHRA